jgi:F0F1-type ATP synthase assembly protein I
MDKQDVKVVGLATGLGCSVVASLVVFIAGGLLLDQWLDTSPVFTLIGVAIGLVGAGYQLWELVLVSDKNRQSGPIGKKMAQRLQDRRVDDTQNDHQE